MIQLVPMNQAEFIEYLDKAVQDYAEEHIETGRWSADSALQSAREDFDKLLPEGVATPNQYLLTIKDEQERVGMLWFAVEAREAGSRAFLYDIRIDPAHRRRGYGSQALAALEETVRELGLPQIMLHVFGHNLAARAMYEKLGYEPLNLVLSKTLDS